MDISTTGDLRGFLGEILLGVRDGTVSTERAASIAKIAQQINQSISTEVNAAIQLKQLGEGHPVAGSMVLTRAKLPVKEPPALPEADQDGLIWCDQCDMRVDPKDMRTCKSGYCQKLKAA